MATTAATFTLTTGGTNFAGFSLRSPITLSAGVSAQRVRVKFGASSSSGLSADHCSIGIRQSGIATTDTPVELKFSGVSGFSIATSGQITSDWATLPTVNGTVAVVVIDVTAAGTSTAAWGNTGINSQSKAASATYNTASPAGFSDTTIPSLFVLQVEVANAFTLNLDAGVYAITGIAAFLGRQFIILADAGSYALTGVAAGFRKSLRLLAATGSYTITGVAARLGIGLRLFADAGSYAVTGVATQLRRGLRILAAPGSYAITGLALVAAAISAGTRKIRAARFRLQKLRQEPPTLTD